MNRILLSSVITLSSLLVSQTPAKAQDLVKAAGRFISLLDSTQRIRALYPFDTEERYGFHYFPIDNRKGIPMDQLNTTQTAAAMYLIKTCLTEGTVKKIKEIMQLEKVLIEIEHRKPEDHFRDPGKYFLAVFGIPGDRTVWGWRLEGHHVSFNFSADNKQLVAGTPGFLGANPAIVQEGDQKGKEVLKDEKEMAFALLHKLSADELKKALADTTAPGDIVTYINRKAMIEHPSGILYSEMSSDAQQQLLRLVNLYVHRFTKLFADNMLKEIQTAGVEKLRFAWMGQMESGPGHPHYYRIQGPTLIIEYDNTQNNANHVHTVVRDLLHDYGGDLLLEHYKTSHQN
ncbi:MAG: DUF3500 domain-containing protein [Puia sp.]|nr:DUF3500 domain-containing protein [Puia sp.]